MVSVRTLITVGILPNPSRTSYPIAGVLMPLVYPEEMYYFCINKDVISKVEF
jgi:hypothetical protein